MDSTLEKFNEASLDVSRLFSHAMCVRLIIAELSAKAAIIRKVRDGQEGYLLDVPTAASLGNAIDRASKRILEQRSEMRKQASLRARESFGYQNYAGALAKYLTEALQCG